MYLKVTSLCAIAGVLASLKLKKINKPFYGYKFVRRQIFQWLLIEICPNTRHTFFLSIFSTNTMLLLFLLSVIAITKGQLAGTLQQEVHPTLFTQTCTSSGCSTTQNSIVLDSNWRWTHLAGAAVNCYTGNLWNSMIYCQFWNSSCWFLIFAATACPDPVTCASNCAIEGVNYQQTYGITTEASSLRINFVTKGLAIDNYL